MRYIFAPGFAASSCPVSTILDREEEDSTRADRAENLSILPGDGKCASEDAR